jgi:hypothetical protein
MNVFIGGRSGRILCAGFILAAVPIAEPLTAGVHLALEQAQLQIVAMFLLPTVQTP